MKKLKLLVMSILAITAIYSCGDSTEAPTENQAPSKPKLTNPLQGAMEVDVKPTFKWEESIDPEKGAVTYEIYVSKNESFSGDDVFKAIDIHQPSYTFNNVDLERATKYYWKVIAYDKKKNKSESEVQNFTTIDENLKITLLEPQNKAALDTNHTKIKWEVKRNSVYNKDVTYAVFLRNGSDEFSTPFKTDIKEKVEHILEEMTRVYKNDNRPWVIGYSGGKDSTTVVQLAFIMLKRLSPNERHKDVYVVSSDTLIENPIVLSFLQENSKYISDGAKKLGLPLYTHMVHPDYNNTFWANVIGKGLPTPTSIRFRWCTERLKIKPSNKFIEEKEETQEENKSA